METDKILSLILSLMDKKARNELKGIVEAIQELLLKPIDGEVFSGSIGGTGMAQEVINLSMGYGFTPDLTDTPVKDGIVDEDYEFLFELMDEAEMFMNNYFSDDLHFWGNHPDLSDWGYWAFPIEISTTVVFQSTITRDLFIKACHDVTYPNITVDCIDENNDLMIVEMRIKYAPDEDTGLRLVKEFLADKIGAKSILFTEVVSNIDDN